MSFSFQFNQFHIGNAQFSYTYSPENGICLKFNDDFFLFGANLFHLEVDNHYFQVNNKTTALVCWVRMQMYVVAVCDGG